MPRIFLTKQFKGLTDPSGIANHTEDIFDQLQDQFNTANVDFTIAKSGSTPQGIKTGDRVYDTSNGTLRVGVYDGKTIQYVTFGSITGAITDDQHGARGYTSASGQQHPNATNVTPGFESAADKVKIDAAVQSVTGTLPITSTGGTTPVVAINTFTGSGASAAKGAVPAPSTTAGTTKFLREDATFAIPAGTGVTTVTGVSPISSSGGTAPAISIATFVASGVGHARGAVPDPGTTAGTTKFLREDATFAVPAGGGGGNTTVTFVDAAARAAAIPAFIGQLGVQIDTNNVQLYQGYGTTAGTWEIFDYVNGGQFFVKAGDTGVTQGGFAGGAGGGNFFLNAYGGRGADGDVTNSSVGGDGGGSGSLILGGGVGNSGAGGPQTGGTGGTVDMHGSQATYTAPGGNGGTITAVGGVDNTSNAGSLTMSGGGGANAPGGPIDTSGVGTKYGGAIYTYGGVTGNGGSLDMSNDGGSISTRGTGSIGFGVTATRTLLNGSATTARTITMPNATGTLLLTNGNGSALTNLNASALTTGTVATARLGSGTASSTTYLRGDQSWQSLPVSAPTNATYITQTPNATLSAEQALSLLATGIVFNTTATGVLSIAVAGTDYLTPTGDGSGLTGFTASQIPNLDTSKLTTGTMDTARLGSGAASATTFLRGDQTWATPKGINSLVYLGI